MSSYSFKGKTRIWKQRDGEMDNSSRYTGKCEERSEDAMITCRSPPNSEKYEGKWSLEQLLQLLRLYGAHRCLWDLRDADNRNRKLRHAALVDITSAMGGTITERQVLQKIAVLRATYRYERRRIKHRIRNGKGARTKLKWFALAHAFLKHVPRMERFRRNECVDSGSDLEDSVVFTVDPDAMLLLDRNSSESAPSIKEHLIKTEDDELGESEFYADAKDTNYKTSMQFSIKSQWTAKKSLQFVELLSNYPTLWNDSIYSSEMDRRQHIMKIAKAMQVSLSRIERRVHIFKRTCQSEGLKMRQNINYRPKFIWWHIAERFIPMHSGSSLEPAPFVDANAQVPSTPLNLSEIKKEEDTMEVDVNPIPSVPPASVLSQTTEQDLKDLFHSTQNGNIIANCAIKTECQTTNDETLNLDENAMPADLSNPGATSNEDGVLSVPTESRFIWNGLEDDLLEGKWSLKHSVKFLRLYGVHRCLWDLNDPDNRSRELRNAAIADIAAAMGYGLTTEYVAKKIKIFRITYMQHRKRILEALKQGKEPEIQLRWFPLADSFLRPHIGLRSIKENEREMPQFDFQYVYANLNLIDPALLTDFRGKGTQNTIDIGDEVGHVMDTQFELPSNEVKKAAEGDRSENACN